MNVRRLAWLALALCCATPESTVIVDVVTDFAPGTEFQAVRTRIVDGPEALIQAAEGDDDQYLRARRVATFDSELRPGEITVRVELLRPDGAVLASQSRSGTLTNILAVTAVFTRNCQDVRCREDEVCIDETCVSNACDPSNPATCPDSVLCVEDEDCLGPILAECARNMCIGSFCLVETDHSECGAGLYCNAEVGCSPRPTDGACVDGAPCPLEDNPCEAGVARCEDGALVCEPARGDAMPDGTSCGETVSSDWSDCVFVDVCTNEGQRSRAETLRECQSGTCSEREATGTEVCARNTNGETCAATTCTSFSVCAGFADRCDLGGSQSRTCTVHSCDAGVCVAADGNNVQDCSRTLSETCGDLLDTNCNGNCDEGCRVPVYRGVLGTDHFFTRSLGELTGAGYASEGIGFYVYANAHPTLVALYRCRLGGDHFVSVSPSCEGASSEGIIGYVRSSTQPACGSVPLYRLHWPGGADHFFTTSNAERSSAIPPYVPEGDAAHVWQSR